VTHRQQRLREFKLGKTTGKNIHGKWVCVLYKHVSTIEYALVTYICSNGFWLWVNKAGATEMRMAVMTTISGLRCENTRDQHVTHIGKP
jgi:hypothetical protein